MNRTLMYTTADGRVALVKFLNNLNVAVAHPDPIEAQVTKDLMAFHQQVQEEGDTPQQVKTGDGQLTGVKVHDAAEWRYAQQTILPVAEVTDEQITLFHKSANHRVKQYLGL
jgi:hypothetical protein